MIIAQPARDFREDILSSRATHFQNEYFHHIRRLAARIAKQPGDIYLKIPCCTTVSFRPTTRRLLKYRVLFVHG